MICFVQVTGNAVTKWLAHWTQDCAVRVQDLAGITMLCSWARHFTIIVPLSTQVYRWVAVNLLLGGNPVMYKHPIQGEVETRRFTVIL